MGKHKARETGSGPHPQRFSPTYSFGECFGLWDHSQSLTSGSTPLPGRKKYEREYWFSVPKEKAKNLYHFFKKWAPEIYGDVDDLAGCDERGLEPLTTDDEMDAGGEEETAPVATTRDVRRTQSGAATHRAGVGAGFIRRYKSQSSSASDNESVTAADNTNKMATTAAPGASKPRFWRRRSPLNFLKLVEDHFSTDGMSTEWNVIEEKWRPAANLWF